ncbi:MULTISPECIES: pyridoxamine 5'-phosphate oxidase family protein [Microbacterium]|uniref:pyridoxamine 5'-phosphate oxidase family protein n=1 Tax=Microbacterium TaxID=33882 RepID=UPI00146F6852|nr:MULTISPECIES: pyridoxamine 5'-phosphate oxidase family protein [Microbacterium]
MTTVRHLSTSECWHLLENETLGRLALIGDQDVPDVFPVNFLAHGGAVYIRTAHDSKLVRIAAHPVAGFEVDGADGDELWSVVVRGSIGRLTDQVEIERAGVTKLVSSNPRYKPFVLKLVAQTVTGRRFTRSDAPPTPETRSLPATGAHPAPTPHRDVPFKIPSLPPRVSDT